LLKIAKAKAKEDSRNRMRSTEDKRKESMMDNIKNS
jgi:hypothetical protein